MTFNNWFSIIDHHKILSIALPNAKQLTSYLDYLDDILENDNPIYNLNLNE